MRNKLHRVLVIGATSTIAHEAAKLFASKGASLFLAGRDEVKLGAVAKDLGVRGARRVETFRFDVTDLERHEELIIKASEALDGLDAALIAHGSLPNQEVAERNVDEALRAFGTNCLSVISLATLLGNYFEMQRHGVIGVITSVAGDCGRRSNYVYGAAKGAVSIFLEGLRSRLYRAGVSVVTIKPGLVDTPMTAAVPKNALFATASYVGRGVYEAMVTRKDAVYIPWFWWWIMAVIKLIPRRILKKINW